MVSAPVLPSIPRVYSETSSGQRAEGRHFSTPCVLFGFRRGFAADLGGILLPFRRTAELFPIAYDLPDGDRKPEPIEQAWSICDEHAQPGGSRGFRERPSSQHSRAAADRGGVH